MFKEGDICTVLPELEDKAPYGPYVFKPVRIIKHELQYDGIIDYADLYSVQLLENPKIKGILSKKCAGPVKLSKLERIIYGIK